jgi:hypothetical protein
MIKKVKEGYRVLSSKEKNLGGPYKTLEEAKNAFVGSNFSNVRRCESFE